ncbi:MAG: hypothetical protein ACYS21_01310 [Planctomycetota bacterium]
MPQSGEFDGWVQNREIQECLSGVDPEPRRWVYYQIEDEECKEKGVCTFGNEFVALKIPRLYSEYSGVGGWYICLVNIGVFTPPTAGGFTFELDSLANLVNVWGWQRNYYAHVLKNARPLCRGKTEIKRKLRATAVGWLAVTSREMSLWEVVELAGMATDAGDDDQEDFLKQVTDVFGKNFEGWDCSLPVYRGKNRVAKALFELTVNSNASQLKKTRTRGREEYEKLAEDVEILGGEARTRMIFDEGRRRKEKGCVALVRRFLSNFFFAEAISGGAFRREFWFSEAASEEDLANLFAHMIKVAGYWLTDFPIDGKTIEAMMWLISEYAHHTLGVPERIDFRAHLQQAARAEPGLHSLEHYYRDHFCHALEVCFLGHFLLDIENEPNEPLWKKVALKLGCPEDRKRVLKLWYLAALLHDVGYGIDVLHGVRELLEFFKNAGPLKQLGENLKEAVERLSEELDEDFLIPYGAEDKPGEDHGVLAALHLQKLLESIAKDDKEVRPEEFRPAVGAIAMHNSRKHEVSFNKDPLAFLLILCDTVQEWNRVQMNFATAPAEIVSRLGGFGACEEHLLGPLKQAQINAEYDDKNERFRLVTLTLTLSM